MVGSCTKTGHVTIQSVSTTSIIRLHLKLKKMKSNQGEKSMMFENLITQLESLRMLMRTFIKMDTMIIHEQEIISVYQVFTSIENKEYCILIDQYSQFTSPDTFAKLLEHCRTRYNVNSFNIMSQKSFTDRNVTHIN